MKKYNEKLKKNPLLSEKKPTIGLNSDAWKKQMQNFTELYFKTTFPMRDIHRTFKTLSGMLHFSENERDIVNQHVNKTISKKHYDKYDYYIEKRETTLKWGKAISWLLKDDGIKLIEKVIEKEMFL